MGRGGYLKFFKLFGNLYANALNSIPSPSPSPSPFPKKTSETHPSQVNVGQMDKKRKTAKNRDFTLANLCQQTVLIA